MSSRSWETRASDDWSTPLPTWKVLLGPLSKKRVVWDPCFNDGRAKGFIEELGHVAIHRAEDFLDLALPVPSYDVLASNPPSLVSKTC
jgi:hypothetical protein